MARLLVVGGFDIYMSRSLGPSFGLLAGWAIVGAYLTTAMALTVATSIFVKTLLIALGVTMVPNTVLLYFIVSSVALLLATRDIRLSSRVGLTLEVVSVVIILAVSVMALGKQGLTFDAKQLSLVGVDHTKFLQAVVFAIFSYVGFESAATLGKEARDPATAIPRAIQFTALTAGVFFIFMTYVITQGFADDAARLGASGAPLGDILNGNGPLVSLVYFGATISSFACALASLDAFGRMMYSLGRYGFLHAALGRIHLRHSTPHLALTFGALLNFVLCLAFAKNAEINTFGWYGTLASFGFIVVYLLCSVATPLYLRKTGELTMGAAVFGAAGATLMALSLAGSLYPLPAYPANVLPYIFLAYMVTGGIWFFWLRATAPKALRDIQHDLEIADMPLG